MPYCVNKTIRQPKFNNPNNGMNDHLPSQGRIASTGGTSRLPWAFWGAAGGKVWGFFSSDNGGDGYGSFPSLVFGFDSPNCSLIFSNFSWIFLLISGLTMRASAGFIGKRVAAASVPAGKHNIKSLRETPEAFGASILRFPSLLTCNNSEKEKLNKGASQRWIQKSYTLHERT